MTESDPKPNVWYPKLLPLIKFSPKHIIISQQLPTQTNKGSRQFVYLPYDEKKINKVFSDDDNLYELLPADLPRKFAVDIDIKPSHKNYKKHTYDEIINAMTTIIKHSIAKLSDYVLDCSKIVVSVVKNDDRKQSIHLIYPIYFEDQEAQLPFAKFVEMTILDDTDEAIKDAQAILKWEDPEKTEATEMYFDTTIYSCNQNLRMVYQTKKEYPGYAFEPFDPMIKDPVYYLAGIYKVEQNIEYFNPDELESIVIKSLHKKLYKTSEQLSKTGAEYRNIMHHIDEFSTLVVYSGDELPPPYYHIDSMIEFYVKNIPNTDAKPQSYQLWFSIGQTLKNLVDAKKIDEDSALRCWIDWSNKASKKYKNEEQECKQAWNTLEVRPGPNRYMEAFLKKIMTYYYPRAYEIYHRMWASSKLFSDNVEGFEQFTKYNEQYCKYQDLKDVDGILVKSGMGTGKTYYIKELVKNNNFRSAILVSSRRTFSLNKSYEFRDILPKFTDYTELKGAEQFNWLKCRFLAVQFESLFHINHVSEKTAYDLVILDEIESVLSQVSSTTNGQNSLLNFDTLMSLLNLGKKFVMADGYVMLRSMNFARDISNRFGKKVIYNVNEHKNKGRIAKVLGNVKNLYELPKLQNKFMNHMIQSLKEGKKVCAAVGSLSYKRNLIAGILQAMGPDFKSKIREYDSESGKDVMDDLKNIEKAWGNPNIQLVIYTSKITVGIDFSLKGIFDCCYIYATSTCPIVRDMMQSHYRVRHLNDNIVYVALFSGPATLVKPTMINEHKKNIFIENRFETGIENLQTSPYSKVITFNAFEEQVGMYAYDQLFLKLMEDTGYEIKFEDSDINQTIDIKQAKESAKENAYIMNYIDIKNISSFRILDIERKMKTGQANSLEMLQYQAYSFDLFFIKPTKIPKMSDIEIESLIKELAPSEEAFDTFVARAKSSNLSIKELVETDIYNMHYSRRDMKSYIENVIKETKCHSIKTVFINNKTSVKAAQKDVMKLESIKHMCGVLGLKSSIDNETKITESKVIDYFSYYKELSDIEKQIFDENFGIGVLKAKDEVLRAKQLVNLILKKWNGGGFDRTSLSYSKKTTGSGRKRTYEYFVTLNEDLIIQFFYKTIG